MPSRPHPSDLECILDVRVKPRAKRAGLLGRHGNGIKLAVRAAPERGRANAELVQLLAEALKVDASAVEVVSGATSQDKRVRVRGLTPHELHLRLGRALERT
jgi:uncharacterized protein (TIGR00251 family)